jgi:hypothetical protein
MKGYYFRTPSPGKLVFERARLYFSLVILLVSSNRVPEPSIHIQLSFQLGVCSISYQLGVFLGIMRFTKSPCAISIERYQSKTLDQVYHIYGCIAWCRGQKYDLCAMKTRKGNRFHSTFQRRSTGQSWELVRNCTLMHGLIGCHPISSTDSARLSNNSAPSLHCIQCYMLVPDCSTVFCLSADSWEDVKEHHKNTIHWMLFQFHKSELLIFPHAQEVHYLHMVANTIRW